MTAAVAANLVLTYTPPNAPVNSAVITLLSQASYNGHNVGQIDIPNTVASATQFVIPFASITSAKMIMIKNNMSSEIGLRINGSVANVVNIPPGGIVLYAASAAPNAVPWASAIVVTTAMPTTTETVAFAVFGD